jgi:tetratricopeptide (TPR) repeat protein
MRFWGAAVSVGVMMASAAALAAPAYDSGGTDKAGRLLGDAQRAAYHGRFTQAIAYDTRSLAASPDYGLAYKQRAHDLMYSGHFAEASADLDRVIAMHPDDMGLGMMRVELAVLRGDGNAALAGLKAALVLPLQTSWHQSLEAGTYEPGNAAHYYVTGHMESHAYMYSSIAKQLLHQDDESLADMQAMLKIETQYPEHILANYCYVAAVAGLAESAELACETSIEDNSHDIGQYDSLGFAHLKMKQWDKAIADYDRALRSKDDLTLSLYGRGLAKKAKGDAAGAAADMAAAQKDEPDIAGIMKRLGVAAS